MTTSSSSEFPHTEAVHFDPFAEDDDDFVDGENVHTDAVHRRRPKNDEPESEPTEAQEPGTEAVAFDPFADEESEEFFIDPTSTGDEFDAD